MGSNGSGSSKWQIVTMDIYNGSLSDVLSIWARSELIPSDGSEESLRPIGALQAFCYLKDWAWESKSEFTSRQEGKRWEKSGLFSAAYGNGSDETARWQTLYYRDFGPTLCVYACRFTRVWVFCWNLLVGGKNRCRSPPFIFISPQNDALSIFMWWYQLLKLPST